MVVQVAPTQSQDVGAPVVSDQVMTEADSAPEEATQIDTAPPSES